MFADGALEEDRLPFGPPFLLDRKRGELGVSLWVILRMKDCLYGLLFLYFSFCVFTFVPFSTDSAGDKSMDVMLLLLGLEKRMVLSKNQSRGY